MPIAMVKLTAATERALRGNLRRCWRGNGDGLGTYQQIPPTPSNLHGVQEVFCLCDVCRLNRYRRREVAMGRLTQDQIAALDAAIEHLIEEPTTEGTAVYAGYPEDEDDAEHAGDIS